MNNTDDILKQTKQALSVTPSGVFILAGKEEYLKRNFVSDIKAKLFSDELALSFDYSRFDGEDAFESVFETLDQPPTVAERRVAVWYEPPVQDKSYEKKLAALCADVSANPDVLLILYLYPESVDTSDKGRMIKLSSLGRLFKFDTLPIQKLYGWVRRHFAADGCEIDDAENTFLCQRVCCDMTRLASEITKLCGYLNEIGKTKVSRSMIETIVPAETVFENFYLSGRISERDSEGVIRYFANELESGTDPIMLLGSFTAEVEKLARIKAAAAERMRVEDIAKISGMHEYAVKLKLAALRNFKEKETEELVTACYMADAAMKSTAGDKTVILYRLACLL